ncbi:unnamed protein product [Periconia digitata]|uniref:Methyltransferase domain-containing protein n=1 Tax=Periconia digitata TaxID=1303443 RepID=A0A9W4XXJ3_9PLEO|nr:unnamed protein product [Periconia digitata]
MELPLSPTPTPSTPTVCACTPTRTSSNPPTPVPWYSTTFEPTIGSLEHTPLDTERTTKVPILLDFLEPRDQSEHSHLPYSAPAHAKKRSAYNISCFDRTASILPYSNYTRSINRTMATQESTPTSKDGTPQPREEDVARHKISTQNTQYDQIGMRYNSMHDLPAVQPEKPSVVTVLGDVKGKKCLDLACGTGRYTSLLSTLGATTVHGYDISTSMIAGATSTYPPSTHPTLHFAVADCSNPSTLPSPPHSFDIVFAGWFLNYAGTARELTDMFRVIASQLCVRSPHSESKDGHGRGGRFVGLTTNGGDPDMKAPKHDFYGIEVVVLDPAYRDPETGVEVGIKARVVARTEPEVRFDVFQFTRDVYQRCAEEAGLVVRWRDVVLPEGEEERKEQGYWERFLERPTFDVLEAWRA